MKWILKWVFYLDILHLNDILYVQLHIYSKKIVIIQAKIDQLAGLQAMTHKLWLACKYKGLLWWFEDEHGQQDGAVIIACTVILHIEGIIAVSLQAIEGDPWDSGVYEESCIGDLHGVEMGVLGLALHLDY